MKATTACPLERSLLLRILTSPSGDRTANAQEGPTTIVDVIYEHDALPADTAVGGTSTPSLSAATRSLPVVGQLRGATGLAALGRREEVVSTAIGGAFV